MNVFIHKNEQQTGPFTQDDIHAMLDRGEITTQDFAWTEGLPNWQPLANLLPAPAKPPAPQAQATIAPRSKRRRLTTGEGLIILGAAVIGSVINHQFGGLAAPDLSMYIAQIIGGTLLLFGLSSLLAMLIRGGSIAGVVVVAVLTYIISSQGYKNSKAQRDTAKPMHLQEQDSHTGN